MRLNRLINQRIIVLTMIATSTLSTSHAQVATTRIEGLHENNPNWHVLVGARLVLAPGKVIDNGSIVIRDGVVAALGPAADVPLPAGAKVWKLSGRTIYPGMIDMASALGVSNALAASTTSRALNTRNLIGRSLSADNARIHPEQNVAQQLEIKADEVKAARELGFTQVLAVPAAGIFRGESALLSLKNSDNPKALVLNAKLAQHLANELDPAARSIYPSSLMGVIAQVRQTFYDAQWYQKALLAKKMVERPQLNASLEALQPVLLGKETVIYATDNEQAYQRIAKLRDEFKFHLIFQGNGYEYRRLQHLQQAAAPIIVPLNFPNAPEVEHPDLALDTSLEAMQHWEMAPSNLKELDQAGITFAISATGLKDPKKEFWPRVRQAVRRGLSADKALAALTMVPAQMLGESKNLGRIEVGQAANFVVSHGDLFNDDKAMIEISFVEGKAYTTDNYNRFDLRGTWTVQTQGRSSTWTIAGTAAKPSLSLDGVSVELTVREGQLLAHYGNTTIVAEANGDQLAGSLQEAQAAAQSWTANRTAMASADTVKPIVEIVPTAKLDAYPAGPFAMRMPLAPKAILLKNATIWTSAAAGNLEASDMLVVDGKIRAIGKNLKAPEQSLVIDATGKHLSPGLVDAHSHTAIMQGINEGTSSITAEVRIADVIDASNINIYRELAGGLTSANLLHGSANTIGGQNQIIKLRWGADAEGLKLENATPGIKFALGENVKQSNWGNDSTGRYPQTRMGVEQILRSAFLAAQAYRAEYDAYRKSNGKMTEPRRDLQLDTLVELLERKRVIHIHSYRQDEILMFARIAQEFNLKVATFQHVMEGYKVADVIAGLGAGGSTFSDWWGYKMEVADAIPYNGALMHQAGVVTSFNSDSDELARHLNTEAAKAVKYGGLSETEAFKFVTINPAKQLQIDQRTGSLEVGKDADFVIWSASPLSTFSRAEQTWIEGKRYFDLALDAQLRNEAQDEKRRLTEKIIAAKTAGASNNPSKTGETVVDKNNAVKPKFDSLEMNQQHLELQHWLHQMSRYHTGYWVGEEAHECTEDQ